MQFTFMSAVLCFMMVPTAMGEVGVSARSDVDAMACFGFIRGVRVIPAIDVLAQRALIALPCAVRGAIAVTFAGYWKQMRAALAPSARVAGNARLRRRLAALITGRDRIARGTSDFILTTLARSRAQQVPIAICARRSPSGLSVCSRDQRAGRPRSAAKRRARSVSVDSYRHRLLDHRRPPLRRSSMPTELRAAWAFRVHARLPSTSYWSGVRAAMLAFAIVPALARQRARRPSAARVERRGVAHDICLLSPLTIAAQFASIIINSVPFTRAYPPGTRSSKRAGRCILLGMYAIAYWPVRWNFRVLHDPTATVAWLHRGRRDASDRAVGRCLGIAEAVVRRMIRSVCCPEVEAGHCRIRTGCD